MGNKRKKRGYFFQKVLAKYTSLEDSRVENGKEEIQLESGVQSREWFVHMIPDEQRLQYIGMKTPSHSDWGSSPLLAAYLLSLLLTKASSCTYQQLHCILGQNFIPVLSLVARLKEVLIQIITCFGHNDNLLPP